MRFRWENGSFSRCLWAVGENKRREAKCRTKCFSLMPVNSPVERKKVMQKFSVLRARLYEEI